MDLERKTRAELHRRKLFSGLAMIAAPLVLGTAYLLGPADVGTADELAAELAANPTRIQTGALLYLVGVLLFAYVAMALAHLLREEQPWVGQVGAVISMLGLIMMAAIGGGFLVATQLAEADTAATVTLLEALGDEPAMLIAFFGSSVFALGMVVLAIGLLLARTAPLWSAALLAIGVIVQATGDVTPTTTLALFGVIGTFLGLAPLGYELLTEPDEAWEHPARFEGFQPVTGAH